MNSLSDRQDEFSGLEAVTFGNFCDNARFPNCMSHLLRIRCYLLASQSHHFDFRTYTNRFVSDDIAQVQTHLVPICHMCRKSSNFWPVLCRSSIPALFCAPMLRRWTLESAPSHSIYLCFENWYSLGHSASRPTLKVRLFLLPLDYFLCHLPILTRVTKPADY